jgi:hypothetical protein
MLMDKYGVNTQKWRLATTAKEAEVGAKELSTCAIDFRVFAKSLSSSLIHSHTNTFSIIRCQGIGC